MLLEIRESQNLAKLGGEPIRGGRTNEVKSCNWGGTVVEFAVFFYLPEILGGDSPTINIVLIHR